jgi:Protein kinase domain
MVMGVPDVLAGRYERRGVLGQGGMGTVYDAWDRRLERAVAVKVLRPAMAADATVRARFEAEARAAATLIHPNVVAVFDSGDDAGTAFLVMERLPGHTLRHEISGGPLSPDRVRAVLADILAALGAAHDAGIVHRDIKPGNVLFTPDGSAKVADFGIAKSAGLDLTGTGEIVGTTAYLSPERLEGAAASPASDVYAVGVLAYEALTGRKPFPADSPAELAQAIANGPPGALSGQAGADTKLAAVVERAMQPYPEDRYPTAAAMAAALAPPQVSTPVTEPEVVAPPVVEPVVEPVAEHIVDEAPTHVFEPTEVADRTDVLPPPIPAPIPDAQPPVEAAPAPEPAPEPEPEPEPVPEPEPAALPEAEPAAKTSSRRPVGIVAAAVSLIVLVIALAIAFSRGSTRPKLTAGKTASTVATTSTTVLDPMLADVEPTALVPRVAKLTTGLELRVFGANRKPLLEIADVPRMIAASLTPVDDRALYGAHPPIKLVGVAWANRPAANTEVQLYITKFATPADAAAVRVRSQYQSVNRLEQLAERRVNPKYGTDTDPTLGSLDIVHYFDPKGGRPQNGRPAGALITHYRGTKGQYLFEINAKQTANADHQPIAPVIDPQPSIDEVIKRFGERLDSQLNPQRNP